MKNRRPINEDDILLTEMLIGQSYGKLKRSVVTVSSETLNSVGGTIGGSIKQHPYAATGAAVGAGIILFAMLKLMNLAGPSGGSRDAGRGRSGGGGMDILSLLLPLVSPYLAAFLEKFIGGVTPRGRNRNT